jgi:hypothetical protein
VLGVDEEAETEDGAGRLNEDSWVDAGASVDDEDFEATSVVDAEDATGATRLAEEGEGEVEGAGATSAGSPANKSVWAPFMKPISWLSRISIAQAIVHSQNTYRMGDHTVPGSCCYPYAVSQSPAGRCGLTPSGTSNAVVLLRRYSCLHRSGNRISSIRQLLISSESRCRKVT